MATKRQGYIKRKLQQAQQTRAQYEQHEQAYMMGKITLDELRWHEQQRDRKLRAIRRETGARL